MEVTGKIIVDLGVRGGISNRTGSEWQVHSFVIETFDQYPRKICLEIFGADRIASMTFQVGEIYTVSYDIDARESQGRWFNSLRVYRIMPASSNAQSMQSSATTQYYAQQPAAQPQQSATQPQQTYAPAATPVAQPADPSAAQPLGGAPQPGVSVEDLPF